MPVRRSPTPIPLHPRHALPRRLARGVTALAVAGGASVASTPAVAHAGADVAVEGGAFFGYAFGAPRGFHWGLELRARVFSDDVYSGCGYAPNYASAVATARVGTVQRDFFAQLLGGVTYQADFLAAGAQLGVGYQHGAPNALRIPLLLDGRAHVAALYVELDLRTGSGAVDHGVLLPPVGGFNRYGCAIGRPMRGGDGERISMLAGVAPASSRGDALADEAALWHRSAIMEAESVPAFDVLALDLTRAGAPRALVQRAVAAGDDEVLHAHLAATLAGETPTMASQASVEALVRRAGLSGDALLARIAVESWLDGCLGEGAAAERALRESERVESEDARRAQRIIAADERRHAELAWDVLAWVTQVGGGPVRRALRGALDTPLSITSDVDAGEAARLGYLDQDDVARVHDDVREAALRRARAL